MEENVVRTWSLSWNRVLSTRHHAAWDNDAAQISWLAGPARPHHFVPSSSSCARKVYSSGGVFLNWMRFPVNNPNVVPWTKDSLLILSMYPVLSQRIAKEALFVQTNSAFGELCGIQGGTIILVALRATRYLLFQTVQVIWGWKKFEHFATLIQDDPRKRSIFSTRNEEDVRKKSVLPTIAW